MLTCLLKLPLRGPVQYRTAVAIMQYGVDVMVPGCCRFIQSSCLPHAEREKNNQSVCGECTVD